MSTLQHNQRRPGQSYSTLSLLASKATSSFGTTAAAQPGPAQLHSAPAMSQNQAQAQQPARRKLEELNFDNLTLRALPVDDVFGGPVRQVEGACFSRVAPTPVANPQLVVASPDALSLLDIDPSEVGRYSKGLGHMFGTACLRWRGGRPGTTAAGPVGRAWASR